MPEFARVQTPTDETRPSADGVATGLRIGVAFNGNPRERDSWSGSPAGLAKGLEAIGAEVVGIRAELGLVTRVENRLNRVWTARVADPRAAALNSAAGAWSVRRASRLDGIVQIGSGFLLPRGAPVVQWDDLTVKQALDLDNPDYQRVTAKEARRWIARQREAYRRSTAVCVGSVWAARSVIEDYGVPPERVHVVGFARNVEVGQIERDWSRPRFIFIGREWELKNGPRVLRAFARLHAERPDATLDLIGGHPPVDQPGVTGHERLLLSVPEHRRKVFELMSRATCLVVPTKHEAFGLCYAEAGGAAIPSIGTRVGGGRETIGPGGMVVDPYDDDALLDAMRVMADPDTARRLGALAYEHTRPFTWPLVAERVLRALRIPGLDADRLAPFLPTDPVTP